jgi:molybdenum cofactor cytidylyltransferase
MKIAAVVLAAGLARRMGKPKMLLPWGKSTVLGQVISTLGQALADAQTSPFEIVVVTGGWRDAVEAEVLQLAQSLPVRVIFNPLFEAGEMMSSMRVGLAGLGPETEFALIGLGDQPQLSLDSARRVVSVCKNPQTRLALPSFEMRRGHPWLVRRDLWPALFGSETGRVFLRAHQDDILYVEADESVLKDLDTPDDYERDLKMNNSRGTVKLED